MEHFTSFVWSHCLFYAIQSDCRPFLTSRCSRHIDKWLSCHCAGSSRNCQTRGAEALIQPTYILSYLHHFSSIHHVSTARKHKKFPLYLQGRARAAGKRFTSFKDTNLCSVLLPHTAATDGLSDGVAHAGPSDHLACVPHKEKYNLEHHGVHKNL